MYSSHENKQERQINILKEKNNNNNKTIQVGNQAYLKLKIYK